MVTDSGTGIGNGHENNDNGTPYSLSAHGFTNEIKTPRRDLLENPSDGYQETEHGKTKSNDKKKSFLTTLNERFVWETLGLALAAGVLIALVVILAKHDHKPQPDWSHMSLNSLISWLSTISKGCIVVCCTEALGQLKWVWVSQGVRPMRQLRTFDSASRGWYGAAELIWTLRARHFAVLGGLAVILALGIDPFAQNLVRYYPGLVDDPYSQAVTGASTLYNLQGPVVSRAAAQGVDMSFKSNVYNAIMNSDPKKPWSIPQYSCPSANCTWPPAASLDAYALCTDITHELVTECRETGKDDFMEGVTNCTVTLPKSNLTGWYVPSDTVLFAFKGFVMRETRSHDSQYVYSNLTFGNVVQWVTPRLHGSWYRSYPPPANTTWAASECAIQPIVRSFRAQVANNTYSDETLAIWTNYTVNDSGAMVFKPTWGADLGINTPGQTFEISWTSTLAIANFFQYIFGGEFWQQGTSSQAFRAESTVEYAATDVMEAIGYADMAGCTTDLAPRLTCMMGNVAQAVSKAYRDSMYNSTSVAAAATVATPTGENAASNSTEGLALGTVRANATYIAVQWQWLALPVFVWVVAAATLAGTLWKMRSVPKWKNDVVPLLFLYRDESERQREYGVPVNGVDGVDDVNVRLYERDGNMILER